MSVVKLLVLALVTTGTLAAMDAWRDARALVRLGQPGRAAAVLKEARVLTPVPAERWQLGVQALAAAAAGDSAVARRALEKMRNERDLPVQARVAIEARWLQVCAAPCARAVSSDDVNLAPMALQARYVEGLARVDRAAALALARTIAKGSPWKDEKVPLAERAVLLGALYTALEEGGDQGAAHALEVLVWESMPMEPAVAYVVRGLDENAIVKERGQAGLLAHLEAMQEAHQNGEVLRLTGVLCREKPFVDGKLCPAAEPSLRCRAGFAYGKALRQARKPADAEGVLDAVAAQCPELAVRAHFISARATMAVKGAGARAIASCTAVTTRFPDNALADDAWVMIGDVHAREDRHDEAMAAWQRAAAFPGGDMATAAMRRMVMLDVERQRVAAARARLSTMQGDRWAQYWTARLAANPGDMISGLEKLVGEAPLSVEAALARGVLRAQGTGVPRAFALPAGEVGASTTGAGPALLSLGLDQDAQVVLRDALRSTGDARVARALLDAGDAATTSRWARKALAQELVALPDAASAASWRLAYPLAHREAITSAADATGLPHALLFALAREESAFDHAVNSLSGAVGLFQLLPATAVTEAMTLHIPLANEAALKEPDVNARLGASYLARMMRQLKGNPALALAAYNAGPGSVHKWLAADPEAPLDLFIERIPIDETREYVRRVLESFAVYSAIEGRPLVLPLRAADPLSSTK